MTNLKQFLLIFEITILRRGGVFLAGLLLLTAFLGISISATSACNEQKQTLNIKGVNNMTFRFEDYDVKSPEIVQSKLDQLFPKGSSLRDFRTEMEQLGAECHISDALRAKEGNDLIYCQYRVGSNPFIKTQWTVVVKTKDDSNINELKVTVGFIGL
jgi:hypothetical protein